MDVHKPLLTVVIATYKRAENFDRAIRSVLDQPGDFWELLLGDDGSPDHTPEIMARYVDDSRVHHYRNEVNLGMQANLLKIVREAKGRYVFILTDDDYMLPNALEKTKQLIDKNPDAGYFLSHLPTVDERSGKIVNWHMTFDKTTRIEPSLQNMAQSVGSAWVLSRQVLRYDLIDWATWEKFRMNIFFPIIAAGRLLLKAPMVYLAEPLVMHTQFNEVFWHKFGRDELDIQFNLGFDHYCCMKSILHDYERDPEVQSVIQKWEARSLKSYLFLMDKGFYDLIRSLGFQAALYKLMETYQLNFIGKLMLASWLVLLPLLRVWYTVKLLLRHYAPNIVRVIRLWRPSTTLMNK